MSSNETLEQTFIDKYEAIRSQLQVKKGDNNLKPSVALEEVPQAPGVLVTRSSSPLTGHLTWSPQALNNMELNGLPACQVCAGCTTLFFSMPSSTRAFNQTFKLGSGASHAA
eukprot:scaffold37726_cov45-Prasinocladus_malaysianus.AAC.1